MERPLTDPEVIWYGPHACDVCGVTIVKQGREFGGAEFEPPISAHEAWAGQIYPNSLWKPHVHDMAAAAAMPKPMPSVGPTPEETPR